MTDHVWIDEATFYRQMEPTPAESMARIQWWEEILKRRQPRSNVRTWFDGVEAPSFEEAQREIERRKRKKAMENCMHGRLPFPIRWAPDVRST